MIECGVCGTHNSDLALVCVKCRSYLQAKVDTLDLFATAWGVLESPARTFKRIVLAKRKNYAILLSVLLGMGAVFTTVTYQGLGGQLGDAALMAAALVIGGMVLGGLGVPATGLLVHGLARTMGGQTGFRAVCAVIVYAATPVLAILVLTVPIKLAIFGGYLFDHNPSPIVIAPDLYRVLAALELAAVLWMLGLLRVGLGVASGLRGPRPVALALAAGAFSGALMWAVRLFRLA